MVVWREIEILTEWWGRSGWEGKCSKDLEKMKERGMTTPMSWGRASRREQQLQSIWAGSEADIFKEELRNQAILPTGVSRQGINRKRGQRGTEIVWDLLGHYKILILTPSEMTSHWKVQDRAWHGLIFIFKWSLGMLCKETIGKISWSLLQWFSQDMTNKITGTINRIY